MCVAPTQEAGRLQGHQNRSQSLAAIDKLKNSGRWLLSREYLQREVQCPKCGTRGVVHYSVNDYTFMKREDRQITNIEGNFDARVDRNDEIVVTCKQCGNRL